MFLGMAVLAVSLLIAAPVGAQHTILEIRVREAESAQPLSGAQVHVEGLGVGGVTDEHGTLRLRAVGAGARAVEVRLLGFAPERTTMQIGAAGTTALEFELRRVPIALEPVNVVAPGSVLMRQGFYQRMEGGHGTFFTRAEIEEMRPRLLSDVLRRAAGLSLVPTRTGARASSRGARPGCTIQYYVNGVIAPFFDVDQILPGDVEGVEVYRGSATIPPAYNRGTAICGAILIWTRVG